MVNIFHLLIGPCISSLEKRLFKSLAYFYIGLFFHLLLDCIGSLYILDISSLSDTSFTDIFSPSIVFSFLVGVLWSTKASTFDKCQLIFSSSGCLNFWCVEHQGWSEVRLETSKVFAGHMHSPAHACGLLDFHEYNGTFQSSL